MHGFLHWYLFSGPTRLTAGSLVLALAWLLVAGGFWLATRRCVAALQRGEACPPALRRAMLWLFLGATGVLAALTLAQIGIWLWQSVGGSLPYSRSRNYVWLAFLAAWPQATLLARWWNEWTGTAFCTRRRQWASERGTVVLCEWDRGQFVMFLHPAGGGEHRRCTVQRPGELESGLARLGVSMPASVRAEMMLFMNEGRQG